MHVPKPTLVTPEDGCSSTRAQEFVHILVSPCGGWAALAAGDGGNGDVVCSLVKWGAAWIFLVCIFLLSRGWGRLLNLANTGTAGACLGLNEGQPEESHRLCWQDPKPITAALSNLFVADGISQTPGAIVLCRGLSRGQDWLGWITVSHAFVLHCTVNTFLGTSHVIFKMVISLVLVLREKSETNLFSESKPHM